MVGLNMCDWISCSSPVVLHVPSPLVELQGARGAQPPGIAGGPWAQPPGIARGLGGAAPQLSRGVWGGARPPNSEVQKVFVVPQYDKILNTDTK